MADAIESGEESVHALRRLETDVALTIFGAGEDLGLQFVLLSKEQAIANSDFASGLDQAFPIVGIRELAGQKNFDAAVGALAAAEEPSGKDAGIIKDDEIAGLQEVREFVEKAVGIAAADAPQVQHAGAVSGGERFLGDEFAGKVEVEVGDPHGVRL